MIDLSSYTLELLGQDAEFALGKFTVDVAMAAVGGTALSAMNLTDKLIAAVRDKSPSELRQQSAR